MAIDILSAGVAGRHAFRLVNVNTDDNYIYFKNRDIPQEIVSGASYIYDDGGGTVAGLVDGGLYYASRLSSSILAFEDVSSNTIDLTGFTAGGVALNTPTLFNNTLEIGMSTPTNQAVKYYTNGDPLTGLVSGNTYFLKNVEATFSGTQALYSFTSHTFTSAGVTGRIGPNSGQVSTSYTTSWHGTYLKQGDFQGYQDWTVPVSGVYEFTAAGAAAYNGSGSGAAGRGAIVKGRVELTKGEIITVAVGQVGEAPKANGIYGGSGGGTFVVRKSNNEPLFVAGGGSADASNVAGRDGSLTTLGGLSSAGRPAGSTAGLGGAAAGGYSGGGGGFLSAGANGFFPRNSFAGGYGGSGFSSGLAMLENDRTGGYGGFGGGAQADAVIRGQTGGGGGYSGGAGARTTGSNTAGGGGGSFISSSAVDVATSTGLFDGLASFNGTDIANLNSWSTSNGSVAVTLVSSFTSGNEVYPTALDAENGTNQIAIQPEGTSFHAFVPITVDLQNDVIHSSTPHTLTNFTAVTYTFNETPPAGLATGNVYYVKFESPYSYKLSTQPTLATTINFTTPSARSTVESDFVSRVVVNTAEDTLTIGNHGFLVDQPLSYSAGDGTAIGGLIDGTTYYVSEVLDANRIRLKNSLLSQTSINLTSAGTGTAHSFIFLTVNLTEGNLYIPNHGLVSGQSVVYSNNGNTSIGGLTSSETYYVIEVDRSTIRLSSSPTLSPPVSLTSAGTGTHTLTIRSLDFANNAITIPDHGFEPSELVEYDSRGQQEVGGLSTATPYYVVVVDKDNIKLATTPENAAANPPEVVDLVADPAGVGVHVLTSLSKTPDGIYDITTVPSPNTFTVTAKGQVPLIVKTFNPRSSVDLNLDAFKVPSHGFVTGTEITYGQGLAGTPIGGLSDDTHYYVVAINRDYLRLAETPEDAQSGITLPIDNFGTGINHTFTSAQINGNVTGSGTVSVDSGSVLVNGVGTSFAKILKVGDRFRLFPPNTENKITFAASDISTVTYRITKAHTFVTGDTAVFDVGGGTTPTPLVTGYYYFIRKVSDTEITLHGSAEDAGNNTGLVTFSTQGVGTNFTLTKTTPVAPIIRRITAVGSDTQITVDRPYANSYDSVSYSYPTFIYVRPQGFSLHRPFDGGVEMSAGAGTSLAQIVRQTRKYFRYQSGKGIQTSCGINFQPSIDIESMTRFSPSQIICKTRRPHGLLSGLTIIVSQATDSLGAQSDVFNGAFDVIVDDLTTFRINSPVEVPEGTESRAFGFPQFYVRSWTNGAVRSGMFDFQNGAFYEFDGQKLYAVRRSSTQQIAGTVAALQGSEQVFGTNTKFTAQLVVGDFVVMRGQSYRIVAIDSDTRLSIRPEYKGSSGIEKEFDPGNGTTGAVRLGSDTFAILNHGFADSLPVTYNSIDGEPIGGLINGRTYYVDLIDNNNFRLKATPDTEVIVNLSSVGTTNVHSFVPAKSGIIVTKTVDTRIPQEDWSIDPCDGTGPTGYNLDLSRIQMAYIDYSWYGAGKIRFGFKTSDGQVQYTHEFVHNNVLYESYFRSGNLPARYEVVTYDTPTYIPALFHWGTSVMMDGGFDDDNAYLFTANSQTLEVNGTTAKSFAADAINTTTERITIPSHGFKDADVLQFEGVATSGLRGSDLQNPEIIIYRAGAGTTTRLTNTAKYGASVVDTNNLRLFPPTNGLGSLASVAGQQISTSAQSTTTVTLVAAAAHGLTTGDLVKITGLTRVPNHVGTVTVTNSTTFTYTVTESATVTTGADAAGRIYEPIEFTTQGNTQYTYFLYPDGALNNTSGPNYQPLISLRLSPSVSEGLTGKLGDRDVLNRMQLRLQEIGISTNSLVDCKVLLNPRLNNLNFQGVDSPSLTQVVEHTGQDTVSGGVQVYNFSAQGGAGGVESTTTVDVSTLFELSNSILGGDAIFPDGPDILTIAVSRLTGNDTLTSSKLSWAEAQA